MDKNIVVIDTYDKVADIYAREFSGRKTDLKHLDEFLSLLPKNARILDVGCGPGDYSKYMKEKGFSVEGIDLSIGMLQIAKKMFPEVKFKKMDMRKLEYPNQTFDGLCVAYSLFHVQPSQTTNVLKGFYKVLKSNGIMLLMVHEGKGEEMVPEPLNPELKMFFKYYQKDEIETLLQKTGFEVIYESERKPKKTGPELKKNRLFIIARKI